MTHPSLGDLVRADPGEITVVTSTRRLARRLLEDFDSEQIAAGRSAWQRPDILPWDAWADRCWKRLRDRGTGSAEALALSDEQEALLWELSAAGSGSSLDRLLMPAEIAREARRAWALVRDYLVPRHDLASSGGFETRQLLHMASQVETRLRDENWADRHQRLADLTRSPAVAEVSGGVLWLAGFDELTPAQERLTAALRTAGVSLGELPENVIEGAARVQQCPDPGGELRASALAARRWLREIPGSRIGIVLPDLEERRQEVADVFDDILIPDRVLPGNLERSRAWNVSLGPALGDWPMVDAALRALRLLLRPGSFDEIGLFLRSPFVGCAEAERGPRAVLDRDMRADNVQEQDLGEIAARLAAADGSAEPGLADLGDRLRRIRDLRMGMPGRASPERWASLFGEVLKILGWPGDRALDSTEFQCQLKWQQVLQTLAATGAVSGPLSAAQCLDRLRRLTSETTFQPETSGAPVQILGLLETPGLTFDRLWVAGFHHQAWPRPVRPNALLPTALQRRFRMPRAGPDSELEFARRRTERLTRSAAEIVFSWPAQIEDETFRPSPLLRDLSEAGEDNESWVPPAVEMACSARMEPLPDYRLRPWPKGERVGRGAYLLKDMAACPFRAQARARLGADSLEKPRPGISPMDRGSVTHLALQWLWDDWRTREGLASLEQAQLSGQVEAAVRRACDRKLSRSTPLHQALQDIEARRITERILLLLQQDRDREKFSVERLEQRLEGELKGVGFRLQVDRVDRLVDGTLLAIDYKTGPVDLRDWDGERPKDPQLPFYALMLGTTGATVGGLAYGCLQIGQEGYVGLADAAVPGTEIHDVGEVRRPPNDAADWGQAVEEWSRHIEGIVGRFAEGDAAVAPRRMSEDCRYCDLSSLCRRHELVALGTLRDD